MFARPIEIFPPKCSSAGPPTSQHAPPTDACHCTVRRPARHLRGQHGPNYRQNGQIRTKIARHRCRQISFSHAIFDRFNWPIWAGAPPTHHKSHKLPNIANKRNNNARNSPQAAPRPEAPPTHQGRPKQPQAGADGPKNCTR